MSYSSDELDKKRVILPYDDMPQNLRTLLHASENITSVSPETIKQSISMIDSTSLRDSDVYMEGSETDAEIVALCQAASQDANKAAAICVYPNHVGTAAEALRGTDVQIATVNNFPHGASNAEDAAEQARQAIAEGATEIDTVMDYEACFNGDFKEVSDKLRAVADVCHESKVALKIILKASVYSSYETLYEVTQLACDCCHDGDFIKTCTGKAPKEGFNDCKVDVSTFPMSVTLMQAVADYNAAHGKDINLKISGGVKTAIDCERYKYLVKNIMGEDRFNAAHVRFGASSLLDSLRADLSPKSDALVTSSAPQAIKKPGK